MDNLRRRLGKKEPQVTETEMVPTNLVLKSISLTSPLSGSLLLSDYSSSGNHGVCPVTGTIVVGVSYNIVQHWDDGHDVILRSGYLEGEGTFYGDPNNPSTWAWNCPMVLRSNQSNSFVYISNARMADYIIGSIEDDKYYINIKASAVGSTNNILYYYNSEIGDTAYGYILISAGRFWYNSIGVKAIDITITKISSNQIDYQLTPVV